MGYGLLIPKMIHIPLNERGEERRALSAAPVYALGVLGLALSVWAIAVALSRL